MTHFIASISAYDALDQVVVGVHMVDAHGYLGTRIPVYQVTTTIPSEGQDDSREWLKDALIALLEAV